MKEKCYLRNNKDKLYDMAKKNNVDWDEQGLLLRLNGEDRALVKMKLEEIDFSLFPQKENERRSSIPAVLRIALGILLNMKLTGYYSKRHIGDDVSKARHIAASIDVDEMFRRLKGLEDSGAINKLMEHFDRIDIEAETLALFAHECVEREAKQMMKNSTI